MKTPNKPPDRIFLQWHGDADEDEIGEVSTADVTWAADEKVFDGDVEYVRINALTAEQDRLIQANRDLFAACDVLKRENDTFSKAYQHVDSCLNSVKAERDDLAKFKAWVHDYLDGKGIPHHPPGTHGAEGCRIGDRMDYVFAERDVMKRENAELKERFDTAEAVIHDIAKSDGMGRDKRRIAKKYLRGRTPRIIAEIQFRQKEIDRLQEHIRLKNGEDIDKRLAAWDELAELRERAEKAEARVAKLDAAALKLCRELRCPAMEYLDPHVQNAWTALFDLVESRK